MRRALLFGAGLLLLWVALQLLPQAAPTDEPRVYSDEAGTVAARAEPAADSVLPTFMSAGNMAAVLLLAGGIYLAVYLRRRNRSGSAGAPFRTVANHAVGPNESIQLVECAGETLLLGVTAGQISLLKTYAADQFAEVAPGRGLVSNPHFADVLRNYAGNRRTEANGTAC